jgi:predicted nucleic acid-binding protein
VKAASAVERGAAGVIIDTGILVALYRRDDPRHREIARWFAGLDAVLLTVDAVLTESAFFMPVRGRAALARLAASGRLRLHSPDAAGHARMASLFGKYEDQDPDWADLALVWLAEATGVSRIATLDVRDFSVYRIHGRKRFELELLRDQPPQADERERIGRSRRP